VLHLTLLANPKFWCLASTTTSKPAPASLDLEISYSCFECFVYFLTLFWRLHGCVKQIKGSDVPCSDIFFLPWSPNLGLCPSCPWLVEAEPLNISRPLHHWIDHDGDLHTTMTGTEEPARHRAQAVRALCDSDTWRVRHDGTESGWLRYQQPHVQSTPDRIR